jgi:XTP/dITP diphosphohydrolase
MSATIRLLLATHNRGKRREWQALLEELPVEVILPDDLGLSSEVDETGETYHENALLKARALAAESGLPTLADDSGLEVDALEGAPGVRSARYHLGTDEVRYRALLRALEGVPEDRRSARFRCVAALVLPDGREFLTEGVCEGHIIFEPAGEGGFGYDPVFYVAEAGCTMAELPAEMKNRLSHRAHAAQAMRPIIAQVQRT